jgi:hypothetical protein
MYVNNNGNSRVYAKDPNMVARKIAGEMVLVPIREGTGDLVSIYTLNTVGACIWELIDGVATVAQVRDAIVAAYKVTPEQAEADILEFLAELEQFGAISAITRENIGLRADKSQGVRHGQQTK